MIVVAGGTYTELCNEPDCRDIAGSGLRAASVLRNVVETKLVSAIEPEFEAAANAIVAGRKITAEWVNRDRGVGFVYRTPLSGPVLHTASGDPVHAEGDVVLAFGMVESTVTSKSKRLVLDPQQPKDLSPRPMREGHETEALAIVANIAETLALTGADSLEEGARQLLARESADVVITKCAARGALVTTADEQVLVPPFPTERVWPIGSGDVFAAGFAFAWGVQKANPVDAAGAGSLAASRWCSTQDLEFTAADFAPASTPKLPAAAGRIYLAAPFFTIAQRWFVDLARDATQTLGGTVFSPLHDIGRGGPEVADLDIAALRDSSAVLALLDGLDTGTTFEAGWASRHGIPIVVFSEKHDADELKMLRGTGGIEIYDDLSTAVYRSIWHSLGMI